MIRRTNGHGSILAAIQSVGFPHGFRDSGALISSDGRGEYSGSSEGEGLGGHGGEEGALLAEEMLFIFVEEIVMR